jgi:hypothetical protein
MNKKIVVYYTKENPFFFILSKQRKGMIKNFYAIYDVKIEKAIIDILQGFDTKTIDYSQFKNKLHQDLLTYLKIDFNITEGSDNKSISKMFYNVDDLVSTVSQLHEKEFKKVSWVELRRTAKREKSKKEKGN